MAPAVGLPGLAHPHDAAEIVDVVGTAGPSAQGTEIEHPGLCGPEERPTAAAHDRVPIVDTERYAGGRPESAEIPHTIGRRPQKCVRLAAPRLRQSDHDALVVHV